MRDYNYNHFHSNYTFIINVNIELNIKTGKKIIIKANTANNEIVYLNF